MSTGKQQRRAWDLKTVKDRCIEVGECWLWDQGVSSTGYPQACINGKSGVSVRTFVYDVLLAKRRLVGSNIIAECGNKLCCSPACLAAKSRSWVIKQQWVDGRRSKFCDVEERRARAVAQGLSKLLPDQVAAIKALPEPVNRAHVARQYGVHPKTISNILSGHSWAQPCVPTSSIFNLGSSE